MLKGIGIGEYRSFGDLQAIGSLGKINLFVGPNNSGKSNILRFINENLPLLFQLIPLSQPGAALVSRPHAHRGQASIGRIAVTATLEAIIAELESPNFRVHKLIEEIHKNVAPEDILWLDRDWPNATILKEAREWGQEYPWQQLWSATTKQSGGSLNEHWIPETLRRLKRLTPKGTKIVAIPIDREAGREADPEANPQKSPVDILSGKGIILALAAMQNPGPSNFDEGRQRFKQVQDFVRIVTDDASAEISVPHIQDQILVKFKGQSYFPLASLGSGIEQVVLHAVAATSVSDAIVTFEEPELHLHPVLQRQLITFLAKSTSNQYFIATHSAHLIDAIHADTFHVRLINGQTNVEKAMTDAQRHKVCLDLGYRPSDIVQANCIIWVEGPSDRIYVRHWLRQADQHLQEHVHYSIMFYGGKLLSHLSAGETDTIDDGLEGLIELRLLNRQVAIIIDSDLSEEKGQLRDTKVRVRDEIRKHGGLVWITAGREFENYVSSQHLKAAVEAVAPGRGKSVKSGQFDKAVPAAKGGSKQSVDKVAIACKVAEADCGMQVLDLEDQIKELCTFIRAANGLPTT